MLYKKYSGKIQRLFKYIKYIFKLNTWQGLTTKSAWVWTLPPCAFTYKEIEIKEAKFEGEGHNYEFHNVENQKEHWKIWRPSLHRKSLFSWSLLWHTTTTKKRLSTLWFYLWHQKRSQRRKSKYQIPMAYYLWLPRPVGPWGVRLGSIRLG